MLASCKQAVPDVDFERSWMLRAETDFLSPLSGFMEWLEEVLIAFSSWI